jgi:serine/threonine-protein kinase RsbW
MNVYREQITNLVSVEGAFAGVRKCLTLLAAKISSILNTAPRLKSVILPSREAEVNGALDVVEFEVPSRPEMISYIRSRVVDYASTLPFTHEEIEDIRIAVGEAGSNAVRHGGNGDCRIGVRMEKHTNGLVVVISDQGCGFDPNAVHIPEPGELAENGRGIVFMRKLMDEVRFHFAHPGTSVELVKHLHNKAT